MNDEPIIIVPGTGPHQAVFTHLEVAANQIRNLLPYVIGEERARPITLEIACIDSFMVNVRLVADFLVRGSKSMDVLAEHIAPGWEPDAEVKRRLNEWHILASRWVMHMSKQRAHAVDQHTEPVALEQYRQMAADCQESYASFKAAYQEA
ncbi:hypothetical protein ACFYX8_35000 [Streptomyces cyaneofuscatus]|uniref:hypothetical protein n=1 Tax=Streptomyces cyaneofuscatus TaxID=66883 RepID=UPI00368844A9